jgi:hypothetical protein
MALPFIIAIEHHFQMAKKKVGLSRPEAARLLLSRSRYWWRHLFGRDVVPKSGWKFHGATIDFS